MINDIYQLITNHFSCHDEQQDINAKAHWRNNSRALKIEHITLCDVGMFGTVSLEAVSIPAANGHPAVWFLRRVNLDDHEKPRTLLRFPEGRYWALEDPLVDSLERFAAQQAARLNERLVREFPEARLNYEWVSDDV